MGDFRVVKSLVGDSYEMESRIAGGTIEEGDLLKFSAGELIKVVDNDTAHNLYIAMEDAVEDDVFSVVRVTPWIMLEGTAKGTVGEVGSQQSVDVTSTVITVETSLTAAARFILDEVVDATAKTVRITRIPYGIGVT